MMYYKSFIREHNRRLCFLFAILVVVGPLLNCMGPHNKKSERLGKTESKLSAALSTFVSCTDDSTRYVHDSRTFGIWYNRGRFDTALHFPLLTDTIQCTTQTAPQLFSTGPDAVWWFDGQRNYRLGGGGGAVSAANGLAIDAGSVILGYSQVQNLYRAVSIITGPVFFGINIADSLQTGNDSIVNAYEEVSPVIDSYISYAGPFWEAGYKDPYTGLRNGFECDSTQTFMYTESGNNAIGMYPGIGIEIGTEGQFINTVYTSLATNSNLYIDSNFFLELQTNPSGIFTNGIYASNLGWTAFNRISSSMDSALGTHGNLIQVSFNSGLDVLTSAYTIAGHDASFDLTFTTGTVTPSTDTLLLIVNYYTSASTQYAVMVSPKNTQAAATAYSLMVPYVVENGPKQFSLCGAISGGPVQLFTSNTTYTFSFITIDHTASQ